MDRGSVGPISLLYAFLGAPLAWVLHLLLSYWLVALSCSTGWGGAKVGLLGLTAVCFIAAMAAGLLARRNWRLLRGEEITGAPYDPRRIHGFLMIGGGVLALLFGLVILLNGAGPALVPTC